MYAVIKSGGKQYRVEEGEQLEVERLGDAREVELSPVLVVDGDRVLATPKELEAARVSARVVTEIRGYLQEGGVEHVQVTLKVGFRLDES